jgi:hypothetical protein
MRHGPTRRSLAQSDTGRRPGWPYALEDIAREDRSDHAVPYERANEANEDEGHHLPSEVVMRRGRSRHNADRCPWNGEMRRLGRLSFLRARKEKRLGPQPSTWNANSSAVWRWLCGPLSRKVGEMDETVHLRQHGPRTGTDAGGAEEDRKKERVVLQYTLHASKMAPRLCCGGNRFVGSRAITR